MKNVTLTIAAVFLALTINAQENLFKKGDKALNVGLGLGTTLYSGAAFKGTIPPVSVSLEYGFKDEVLEKGSIGLGGYLGVAGSKYEFMGYGWEYTYIIVGARGALHYPLVNKMDTYTGIMLGYNLIRTKEIGTPILGATPASDGVAWSWFAGARYYFTDNLGAMLELGYGISYLNLGLAVKL